MGLVREFLIELIATALSVAVVAAFVAAVLLVLEAVQ